MAGRRIGFAITGSFCTFDGAFEQLQALKDLDADLYPILSDSAATTDTRFYTAAQVCQTVERIAGRPAWRTIVEVEPIGPKRLLDLLVIAPCTGNTLAKMANGIVDTPVAMAAKAHLRNGRPVLIAPSTNDGLGASARNIGVLLAQKNVYFVPYGQDDPGRKPTSLIAHMRLIPPAAAAALAGAQIQPLLREY
ncbi:MAG: dipicolinate synthase subunit B [Clostridiales bacterium]|nr:dipicolinate synthase subunit B [Clostridiales bacterium]